MDKIKKEIKVRFTERFRPSYLEIINESDQHAGPPGRETHFKVTMVSEAFEGLSRVKRHQAVFSAVGELMSNPIHALSLHLYSLEETHLVSDKESPACLGGETSST